MGSWYVCMSFWLSQCEILNADYLRLRLTAFGVRTKKYGVDFWPMLYLRCDKVSRVAGGHQEAIVCTELFGESKVTDPQRLRISRFINVQDVTGLQVSVYYLQK